MMTDALIKAGRPDMSCGVFGRCVEIIGYKEGMYFFGIFF